MQLTDEPAGLSGVGGPHSTQTLSVVSFGERSLTVFVPDLISVHCCLEKPVSLQNAQLHLRGDSEHTPLKGLLGCVTHCQGILVSFAPLCFSGSAATLCLPRVGGWEVDEPPGWGLAQREQTRLTPGGSREPLSVFLLGAQDTLTDLQMQ